MIAWVSVRALIFTGLGSKPLAPLTYTVGWPVTSKIAARGT